VAALPEVAEIKTKYCNSDRSCSVLWKELQ